MRKKRKGFTLIELMIVIAIIAILAAVLVPNFMRAREASRLTACKSNLKNISTAVETYSNDFDGVYPTAAAGPIGTLRNNYLQKNTVCPTRRAVYLYSLSADSTKYWIYCPAAQTTPGVTIGTNGTTANARHRKLTQSGGPILDSSEGIIENNTNAFN